MEGLNNPIEDYQITVNNRFQSDIFFDTMFVPENQCLQCYWNAKNVRDSGFGFGIRDSDSGFSYKKGEARFGIERMQGMGDAKNNHRDYGVEGKFKSGWRDLKNPIRDYLMTRRHLPDRLANWLTLKKLNFVGLVQLECLGRQAYWR